MKKRAFGRHEGRTVDEIVLESADAAVSILNYGCIVRDWRVQGPGHSLPVVLGFPRLEDYLHHARGHGMIAGRVANRTADGRFDLDGHSYQLTTNDGPHHLHGGTIGLGRRLWEMEGEDAANAVHLRYHSPDGEQGYPGAVDFSLSFRLDGARLVCEMSGVPDRPTPINLAQHSYYNLAGGGTVRDHRLWLAASQYTPLRDDGIPEGTIRPVEGTRFDFTEARSFGEADPRGIGYDDNLVLDAGRDPGAPAAVLDTPRSDLRLRLWSDQPAVQVFDTAKYTIAVPGHDRADYGPFAGVCLEAQNCPDSLHNPDWPSIVRTPEAPYSQRLVVEVAPA